MRSVFVKDISIENNELVLCAREYHHLINVVRININEKINVFDKDGKALLFEVKVINKRKIHLNLIEKISLKDSKIKLKVAFGKLKKDAFDLSIKQLVEIGVETIYVFESKYSQNYSLRKDRLEKVIISAMEQSNNYRFPEIIEIELDELLKSHKNIIYFSSRPQCDQKSDIKSDDQLIVIGPEGGLSEDEESKILKANAELYHLPTNILRAQTAVSFCTGFILGQTTSKMTNH